MKAYCVFENFSEEARKIITDNNIELIMNSSKEDLMEKSWYNY